MDPPYQYLNYMEKKTFTKLFALSETYTQIQARIKGKYNVIKRDRSLNHIKNEVKKVPIPLSFTLGNLIVDQKNRRFI